MKNKCLISISHINYLCRSGGSEKFQLSLSNRYIKKGYFLISIFTFETKFLNKYFGVNINNKFYGIYEIQYLFEVINFLAFKFNLDIKFVNIQHLLFWDLNIISNLLTKLNLPINVFLHDYYLICNKYNLINTSNEYCGTSLPDKKKCKNCKNCANGIKHKEIVARFLKDIGYLINKIILPSKFSFYIIKNAFKKYKFNYYVYPLLDFKYKKLSLKPIYTINLAYVGRASLTKGFNEFKNFVDYYNNHYTDKIRLYYFGKDNVNLKNVISVSADNTGRKDNLMIKLLKKYNINVAFAWSNVPETFSYVYHELYSLNIFVITSDRSGNIASLINKNHNGRIFNNINSFIKWIYNFENSFKEINNYRTKKINRITKMYDNQDINKLIIAKNKKFNSNILDKKNISNKLIRQYNPNYFLSFIYRLRFKKYL